MEKNWKYVFNQYDVCSQCYKYISKSYYEKLLIKYSYNIKKCEKCEKYFWLISYENKYCYILEEIKDERFPANKIYSDGQIVFRVYDRNYRYIAINYGIIMKKWFISSNNKIVFKYAFIEENKDIILEDWWE